jgi:hypothetical protein
MRYKDCLFCELVEMALSWVLSIALWGLVLVGMAISLVSAIELLWPVVRALL